MVDFIIRKRVATPATTHTGNSYSELQGPTPFSRHAWRIFLQFSICMKTHVSLCNYGWGVDVIPCVWCHPAEHPSLLIHCVHTVCALAPHDVKVREHTSVIFLVSFYHQKLKIQSLSTHPHADGKSCEVSLSTKWQNGIAESSLKLIKLGICFKTLNKKKTKKWHKSLWKPQDPKLI